MYDNLKSSFVGIYVKNKEQIEKYLNFFGSIENISPEYGNNWNKFDAIIVSLDSCEKHENISRFIQQNPFVAVIIYIPKNIDTEKNLTQLLNLGADGYIEENMGLIDSLKTIDKAIVFKNKFKKIDINSTAIKNAHIEATQSVNQLKDIIYKISEREKRLHFKVNNFILEAKVDSKLIIINTTQKYSLAFRQKKGDNFLEIIHPEYRNYFMKQVLVSIRNKNESLFDTHILYKNKTIKASCEIEPFIEDLKVAKEFRITLDPILKN